MWGFIDWGSQEHQLCIVADGGEVVCQRRYCQSATGLSELCDRLREPLPGKGPVQAVAIERNDGLVVDALLEAGFAVYAINPRQLSRYREFTTPAGHKDDRLDAFVGAEALMLHPKRFVRLEPEAPWCIQLRDLLCLRAELVQAQVRLQHRAREQLGRYFPQFLELGDLRARWRWALWRRVRSPEGAQRIQPRSVTALLKRHRARSHDAQSVLAVLRQPALRTADGVEQGASRRLDCYMVQLELLGEQLLGCKRELEAMLTNLAEHQRPGLAAGEPADVELISSLPGFGPVTVASLYAYASRALAARDLQSLRSRAGVAPVSVLSGRQQNRFSPQTKKHAHMRKACSAPLRQALHHAAENAPLKSTTHRQRYKRYREKGHTHGRACRQLADHLLHVLMALLKSRRPYDPAWLNSASSEALNPSFNDRP